MAGAPTEAPEKKKTVRQQLNEIIELAMSGRTFSVDKMVEYEKTGADARKQRGTISRITPVKGPVKEDLAFVFKKVSGKKEEAPGKEATAQSRRERAAADAALTLAEDVALGNIDARRWVRQGRIA